MRPKNGDKVPISLKGANYQAQLGTATLDDDAFDDVNFTLPKDVPAGAYTINAVNGSITASTQLQVTAVPSALPQTGGGAAAASSGINWTFGGAFVLALLAIGAFSGAGWVGRCSGKRSL